MGETNCFVGNISLLCPVNFLHHPLHYFPTYIILISSSFKLWLFVSEHTKSLLVDCASSHLKHKKFTSAYGSRLPSSSGRILLQSVPGWLYFLAFCFNCIAQGNFFRVLSSYTMCILLSYKL